MKTNIWIQRVVTQPALALSCLATLGLVACGGSGNSESFPSGGGTTPPPTSAPTPTPTPEPVGFTQRDRTALPAIATVFIAPFESVRNETPEDPKNAFNLAEPADADDPQVSGAIRLVLEALRANDGNASNDVGESGDITCPAVNRPAGCPADSSLSVSVADVLPIITADKMAINLNGATANLLGVELGVPNSFGGRSLEEDIIDAALQVIVFPRDQGCDDGDDATPCLTQDFSDTHTAPFQAQFPYVGLPHS